jgi:hypothetical protein
VPQTSSFLPSSSPPSAGATKQSLGSAGSGILFYTRRRSSPGVAGGQAAVHDGVSPSAVVLLGCSSTVGTTAHLLLVPYSGPSTATRKASLHENFRLHEDPLARKSILGGFNARQRPLTRTLSEEPAPNLGSASCATMQDTLCGEENKDGDGSREARRSWRRSRSPIQKIRGA